MGIIKIIEVCALNYMCYVPPARFQVLQVEDVFNLNKHETFNTLIHLF
jgi:hypothetical protein